MSRAWYRALPWLGLFAAAFTIRSLRAGFVFAAGEVRFPFGLDELYHMRRIWFTVVNFPATLDFDRYMNFPEGAPPIWSPFFDWGIAALARLLVDAGDQHAVEVVAAWVPPVLGALAVVAAMGPTRRAYGVAAGWWSGWLLLTPRAHVLLSQPGMVDHHVAVGLLASVLVTAALPLTRPVAPGARPRGAVATGTAAAAAILLWAGALLQVLALQAFLVGQLLATKDQAVARARARALAIMHAVGAVLVAPYCVGRSWAQFGAFSPEVHSNLQPTWLAAGAIAFVVVGVLWRRPVLGKTRWRRLGSALLIGSSGVAAAWWLVPDVREAAFRASTWFTKDPFLGLIGEMQPLLLENGRFNPGWAHDRFSYLAWSFPVLAIALLWQALRTQRADRLLLVLVSILFVAMAVYQRRFIDVAVTGYAWVLGAALAEGFAALGRRGLASRWVGRATAAGLAVAALFPPALAHHWHLQRSLVALRGGEVRLHPIAQELAVVRSAAEWLNSETPPTAGYLDASQPPEYGVLSSWNFGHLLRYYGERPLVQDTFGPWGGRAGFDAARRYFEATNESEALAIAESLRARYVVAAPEGSGQQKPGRKSMTGRLLVVRQPGGRLAFHGGGLQRHRLLQLATDARPVQTGRRPRRAAIYEIVRGARVMGAAPAGQEIRFELMLRIPAHEPIFYLTSAHADASGRYALRLPYPSEDGYLVRRGPTQRSLRVTEADVREGRDVQGPSFEP